MVLRAQMAALAGMVFLAGCGKDIKSKEKVQEAILERLQTKSGLDLKSLDVTTTAVSFEKNLAFASVAFHPKGDTNVSSGMQMNYTLEDRDGQWVVIKVGGTQGHAGMGTTGSGSDGLPPGHPPVDSTNPHATPAPESAGSERTQ